MRNKKLKYIKYYQSDKVLQALFDKLSKEEKQNLYDCLDNIDKIINGQNEKDVFYSILCHYILNKIDISKQIIEKIEVTHNEDPFKSWDKTGEQHDE